MRDPAKHTKHVMACLTWLLLTPISSWALPLELSNEPSTNVLEQGLSALLGENCYATLIQDRSYFDNACLKYAVSKLLGLGIVVGSAIMKIPQIITIILHRSGKGISLASYWLETVAYCIILVYNVRQQNPFSTYGEVIFITIQNIIITLLILSYDNRFGSALLSALAYVALFQCLSWATPTLLSVLFASTIPLTLASKVPQIYINHANQSTGQLSVFAVVTYVAGTTARVFTTWTELDDPLILASNVLASLLNGVLLFQVWLYWGRPATKLD